MHYIDFHVHAFADKIAHRTIKNLAETCHESPLTDGTLAGTEIMMKQWKIDGFVILPIATKPSQHLVCNNWAASCKCDHIFPFGSIHPAGEDVMQELERIRSLGLYGIKLHPDYQNFFSDDPHMIPIYRKCGELNLPVIFHAGYDPLCPDCVHNTPAMAAKAIASAPDTVFIMAHLGGNQLWQEAEQILAGQFENLYLDTALSGSRVPELFRIIEKHGADKILLGSDCPWDSTELTIQKIKRLGLTEQQQQLIFAGNAERLLRLSE